LGAVQETLFIPLWARSVETRRPDPILRDPLALELVGRIDYDFSRFEKRGKLTSLVPCVAAAVFDEWLREFIQRVPGGAVVEIGAGLDTRFERLDDGRLLWFDLDLPDVVELRRRFFQETPRRRFLPYSALDERWVSAVQEFAPPEVMFIAQGVLLYLPEEDVRRLFTLVADRFPGALFACDSCKRAVRDNSRKLEGVRETGAEFRWGIDDIHEIEAWDPRFRVLRVDSVLNHHRRRFGWIVRAATRLVPSLRRLFTLNLLKLGGP
jgi:O-methyltransferase involved in polyketide biosynthesis